ncbi:NB-ARC domain-containing protein [Funiculus sociatus GB2-A5]|uniref:NB-ARC domain-containing protein n=1 Tax=Funiculus sociatus GB2-A5 TaxID=2933946 RepID=A0ABV0JWB0_9CYAN|nr:MULTISPECIES: NB-ARC domain-containing protein [unclassified Trichocoleus]MBD1905521.1 hypothetical protein [Trichocoleus sp. FACHB-832]MBD2065052.1 hypothetical protein [Trichocoleus sp. FACHB-6]
MSFGKTIQNRARLLLEALLNYDADRDSDRFKQILKADLESSQKSRRGYRTEQKLTFHVSERNNGGGRVIKATLYSLERLPIIIDKQAFTKNQVEEAINCLKKFEIIEPLSKQGLTERELILKYENKNEILKRFDDACTGWNAEKSKVDKAGSTSVKPTPSAFIGKLSNVPDLPLNFLPRPVELQELKAKVLSDATQPVVMTGTTHLIGVQGMGGIGKSVIAAVVAQDEEVRSVFPDGIVWLTLGQTPTLTAWQSYLAELLEAGQRTFADVQVGKAYLSELMRDKACLVILDDVWHAKHAAAFDILGQRCKMLLTTRDRKLVEQMEAVEYQMDVLSDEQSLTLLTQWAKQEEEPLPAEAHDVAKECGNLPLALAMIGAMVRAKPNRWGNVLHKLRNADLEKIRHQFPDYPYPDLLKAIQVSVEALEPDTQKRYLDFAVFPEDTPIPEAVLQTFWEPEGLDEYDTQDVLDLLVERSLASRDDKGKLSLHDLQFDYVRKQTSDLSALHNRFLSAYAAHCSNGWHTGSNDGYFFEYLAYHMTKAERKEELRKLLLDFKWLQAKLEATDVYSLIADFDLLPDDASLRLVQGAIKLASHIIVQDKSQLASQLTGRLLSIESPDIQSFLELIKQERSEPWLRPFTSSMLSPGGSLIYSIKNSAIPLLAVVPGSQNIIFISNNKTLKILNLRTFAEPITVTIHNDIATTTSSEEISSLNELDIFSLATTQDGRCAITGLRNGNLVVWEIDSGLEQFTLSGHTDIVSTVAVTPEGKYTISGSWDKKLKIWCLETKKELHTFEGHKDGVTAVTVTSDGHYAISGSRDKTLKLWDLENKKEVHTFEGHRDSIESVTVTPDGIYAISGCRDGTIKIWDLKNKKELYTIESGVDYIGGVEAVTVTLDGCYLIFNSNNYTLKVWDLVNNKEFHTLQGSNDFIRVVTVTPDGKYAISGSEREIQVWDLKSKKKFSSSHNGSSVDAIKLSLDGRCAISMSQYASGIMLKSWDLASGAELNVLSKKNTDKGISLSIPGYEDVEPILTESFHYIALASDNKTIVVFDLQKGTEILLKGHTEYIYAVAATQNGQRAVSVADDCSLIVWDIESGKAIAKFIGDSFLLSCAISQDGLTIVAGDWSGWVHFLRLEGV